MKKMPLPGELAVATRKKARYVPSMRMGRRVRMIVDPTVGRGQADRSDPVVEAMARLKRSAGVYYRLATFCAQAN